MKKYILSILMLAGALATQAQEAPTTGFLLPRMTTAQKTALVNPAKGLTIYNTDTNAQEINTGTAAAPVWSVVSAGSATASKFTNDATNTRVALTNLSDGVTARPVGTEFVITDTGRVGIGIPSTTTPIATLSFNGASSKSIGMERKQTDGDGDNLTIYPSAAFLGGTNRKGGNLFLSSGVATGNSSSYIQFRTAGGITSGTADVNPTTKMTILGNGNVGIGFTNPANKLSVFNNDGTSYAAYIEHSGGTIGRNGLRIYSSGTSINSTVLHLSTINYSDLLVASGNGNIGIGTAAPTEKLEVVGAIKIGTTATATPTAGTIRFNTTSSKFEGYDGTAWVAFH